MLMENKLESLEKKKELSHLAWDLKNLSLEGRRVFEGEVLKVRGGRVVRVLPAFSEKWWRAVNEIVHGSQCQLPDCSATNCRKWKGVLRHGSVCKIGEDGGCFVCKLMWHHLRIHALWCEEKSNCSVPHCRDLKVDKVLHSSRCQSSVCEYPNCSQTKELFAHGMVCKTGGGGGCVECQKMWRIIKLHTEDCQESNCSVVGCRELKEYLSRTQQQEDC